MASEERPKLIAKGAQRLHREEYGDASAGYTYFFVSAYVGSFTGRRCICFPSSDGCDKSELVCKQVAVTQDNIEPHAKPDQKLLTFCLIAAIARLPVVVK